MSIASIIFCSAQIVSAFNYQDISVSDTKGNITVNSNQFDGLTIHPSLVFNDLNDSITYQIPLTNTDDTEFQIESVTDDNASPYIATSIQYDTEMNADDKTIYVTLTYADSIPFGEELNLDDIHIAIQINEKEEDTSGTISSPDTGKGPAKYLHSSQNSQSNNILSYVIIGIISLIIVIFTIAPPRHRVKFSTISAFLLVFAALPFVSNHTFAKSTELNLTITTSDISAVPIIENPENVVSFIFPNIYNNKVQDRAPGTAPGNAIIMKTLDEKYVLLDTGPSTENIRQVIYDKFKELQGKDDVTIDYLIISHLDTDHYGNATSFINNESFTINNIVIKHEQYIGVTAFEKRFTDIAQAAASHNINIITSGDDTTKEYMNTLIGTTNYDKLSEGMTIQVGKYLKLDFFNTANAYDGKECKTGKRVFWTSNVASTLLIKTADDKYIYFDGSEYPNVTLRTTDTPVAKENGSGINKYFYAYEKGTQNLCAANPNSFGVLAEVTTTGLKKYAYFPGDIENAGYSVLASGCNSAQILEDYSFANGKFTTDITPYVIPSETKAAEAIYNKLENDARELNVSTDTLLHNIVFYQSSHHGINNSEEAIQKLKLNRSSNIYTILDGATNQATSAEWLNAKTYWYTLGNIPAENKLRVGINTIDGINCTVDMLGQSSCLNY